MISKPVISWATWEPGPCFVRFVSIRIPKLESFRLPHAVPGWPSASLRPVPGAGCAQRSSRFPLEIMRAKADPSAAPSVAGGRSTPVTPSREVLNLER